MRRALLALALLALPLTALAPTAALANAPAPWWACEGKTAGDACSPYGGETGVCELQASCTDDNETTVDECLYCRDTTPADDCQGAGPVGALGASLGALFGLALFARRRRRDQ